MSGLHRPSEHLPARQTDTAFNRTDDESLQPGIRCADPSALLPFLHNLAFPVERVWLQPTITASGLRATQHDGSAVDSGCESIALLGEPAIERFQLLDVLRHRARSAPAIAELLDKRFVHVLSNGASFGLAERGPTGLRASTRRAPLASAVR